MEAIDSGKFVLNADGSATAGGRVSSSAERGAEQQQCAVAVVTELLYRAGLSRILDPKTFSVIVGEGNWISFSFQMQRGADHSSLDQSTSLRRTSGKPQQSNARKSAWFRSVGFPSLHFEVIPAERLGEISVRGHVDAADPKKHPVAHLFRDFLPALGLGTHPAPAKLLATMKPQSKK
jgi:hypothetical protein